MVRNPKTATNHSACDAMTKTKMNAIFVRGSVKICVS